MKKTGEKKYAVFFGIFLLLLWEGISLLVRDPFMAPGPLDVLQAIWTYRKEIFTVHLPATLYVMVLGGALSTLTGMLFAVLMDLSPLLERALYPLLTATQTIPTMCIAPVFVLWLGYTVKMRVLVVVLSNFFTVTVDLFDGLRSAGTEERELMRSFGANREQTFRYLKFPAALPYFFTALRVTVPWSAISAAVSEWLGAEKGLGTYSRFFMAKLNAAGLLAPLVVLTVVALLLNGVLNAVEKRVITWRGSQAFHNDQKREETQNG